MTVTQVRYEGSWTPNQGWGGSISASGPYVLVSQRVSAATGFWLYKRTGGILSAILTPYTPTIYTPSWSGAAWGQRTACWYDEDNAKLHIVVSAMLDNTGGSSYGAVYFLDWPDSGAVAGDMVELGRINGEFTNHKLGSRLAICDGRAIATEGQSGGTQQVTFYSRSGATWSQDERITCTGYDADGDVGLWQKNDSEVLGIVGCPLYSSGAGRIYVRHEGGSGWSTVKTIDGSGSQQIGKSCAIGTGYGLGTLASWCAVGGGGNGAKIWDRIDDTTWTERGIIKSYGGGALNAESLAIGYRMVFFGSDNYTVGGNANAGAVNVSLWTGTWPVGAEAALLLEPDPSQANEYGTFEDALEITYQSGGHIRLISGAYGWDVAASEVGSILEFIGDDDWPYPTQIDSVVGPSGSAIVSTRGGELLTVTGVFPTETTILAYFGENGDSSDEPCYFPNGDGYSGTSEDGTTFQVAAPPHNTSTTAVLTVTIDGISKSSSAIEVVEHMYSDALYDMRKVWPRDFNTGPRSLDVEPWQE